MAYQTIINVAILTTIPLDRWLLSIIVMIPKDKYLRRINRLRVINIYEANYSMILKLISYICLHIMSNIKMDWVKTNFEYNHIVVLYKLLSWMNSLLKPAELSPPITPNF